MVDRLAIIAGFGALSQEVDMLAASLPAEHFRYTIKPWFQDPFRLITESLRQTKRVIGLDPFQFSVIERELREKEITHIFLTGDFPWDRYLQDRIAEVLRFRILDDKCSEYYDATPTTLSRTVRYFISLSRLLDDLAIKPLLAKEIFPDLNFRPKDISERSIPESVLKHLPDVVTATLKMLRSVPHDRNRFSQAVIVDSNTICEIEANGTKELLHRYGNSNWTRRMPLLLKLPSADFPAALDQPTIGPDTVVQCSRAGIKGIVVCAETTVVVQKTAVVEQINASGMFLHLLPLSGLRELYLRVSPESWVQTETTGHLQH